MSLGRNNILIYHSFGFQFRTNKLLNFHWCPANVTLTIDRSRHKKLHEKEANGNVPVAEK
jgi:hypothetical protein